MRIGFEAGSSGEMHDLTCEEDIRICPACGKEVARDDMLFTHDCHGITFRLVCFECYDRFMAKGYDGEYYSEADECLDEDY